MRVGAYSKLINAIVESALVTWFGLVFYGIATVALQGHITTNMDIGFVMIYVVPIIFGIFQCLITVRLELASSSSLEHLASGPMQNVDASRSKGIIVSIEQAITVHNDPGHPLDEKYHNLAAKSDSK
ncbi:uncharacterized protein PHACADRAFT_194226 [Phanerochaete carnosa HHB-10118-sp]|uniref:Uncharacterized protein n=1 Tax=Phanerochaete carnosa (strain HHB-10118-sp) TaxID=650164 RepID=K5WC99_PHACS|nr:uncharacterized protein PHACADRAFT_194226 [Phanerochaete carnosa HHB-10118-sp]EKM56634.1 hypothetical protein PHACADRAFT_194226 [Phanerochaete carnosa HHB-10118-sp]